MQLTLERIFSNNRFTGGILFTEGQFSCFTCEDRFQEMKVKGETRIAAGKYHIVVVDSPKHGPDTLQLENVPNFTSIQIHTGNSEVDTEGCLLVGEQLSCNLDDAKPLFQSKHAFSRLHPIWLEEAKTGNLWITIIDGDR